MRLSLPRHMHAMAAISLRLPDAVSARLQKLADRTGRMGTVALEDPMQRYGVEG